MRILDATTFGQYREFVAFSMLATNLAAFSINTNLLYFVSRDASRTQSYVSHTVLLTLITSLFVCALLFAFGSVIRSNTSFDFLYPMLLYVLFLTNFTFLESYWIATKKPENVFYFVTLRTAVRLAAVIIAAYQTKSVETILTVLILVEIIRVAAVLVISKIVGLLSFRVDLGVLATQWRFIGPLGVAGSLGHLNQYVGQIAISTQLGVAALAIFAVASYKVPVLKIFRGAVGDAIFPDMVHQASTSAGDRLKLWKRGNVGYSFLIIPVFVLLFWYADILVPFAFTDQYVQAVPLFRIMLLIMPVQCIELSSPLRAVNRTGQLLTGNAILLMANLFCIIMFFLFFEEFAIFGPAVGLVVGDVVQHIFLGWRVIRIYDIRVSQLLKWKSQGKILFSTALGATVLAIGEYVPIGEMQRVLVFSLLFALAYFYILRRFKLEEVETILTKLVRRIRGSRSSG